MVAAYFVAVLLFVILFFVFLHKSPKDKGVLAYNIGVFALTTILCTWYILNLHGEMEGLADEQWFYIIAPLTALGIAIVVLAVSGLLRNYVIFRR